MRKPAVREDEGAPELAAFTTRSKAVQSPRARPSASQQQRLQDSAEGLAIPPAPCLQNAELCAGTDAGAEQHMADLERLLQCLSTVVDAQEPRMARAIALTEERCAADKHAAVEAATQAAVRSTELRCAAEKDAAVEAATQAAVRSTELRCADELREAVRKAVEETKRAAQAAQDQAVAEAIAQAIQQTEERCAQQQQGGGATLAAREEVQSF